MRPQLHLLPARAAALALAAAIGVAACSSPSGPTKAPGSTATPPASIAAPPATTSAGDATAGPVAGEPCSFLTAAEVGTIVGTVPVEVAERAGRGDCDYWLDAAKTTKVNVGVSTGPDGVALFDSTKNLGEPLPVPNLGDDAYMLVLEGLGTLVVVKAGDTVAAVQLLTTQDSAEQAIRAINLARAVIE